MQTPQKWQILKAISCFFILMAYPVRFFLQVTIYDFNLSYICPTFYYYSMADAISHKYVIHPILHFFSNFYLHVALELGHQPEP